MIEYVNLRPISVSLVGVMSSYPRGNGNYMRVSYQDREALIMNLSYEDLKDAIEVGDIDGPIVKCKIFEHKGRFAIYVIDERFPEICLKPFWRYGINGEFFERIIREMFNYSKEGCLFDNYSEEELSSILKNLSCYYDYSVEDYVTHRYTCPCCDKPHNTKPVYRPRKKVGSQFSIEMSSNKTSVYGADVWNELLKCT